MEAYEIRYYRHVRVLIFVTVIYNAYALLVTL
jgi:hypothetical protein